MPVAIADESMEPHNNIALLKISIDQDHTSATAWNSLPARCRNCLRLTVETFRKRLKTCMKQLLSPLPSDCLCL